MSMQSEFVNLKIQLDDLRIALVDAFHFGASVRYISDLNGKITNLTQRISKQLNFLSGTSYN